MTEPDHKPDGSGLDDGPWLPRCGPRKKPTPKTAEEMATIRTKAWKTRRSRAEIEAAEWHEAAEKRLRKEADILYAETRFSEAKTREIQATIHGNSAKHFRSRVADRSTK